MPTMAYVTIIEIAIPGEYLVEVPAKMKIMGTTEAVPKPTNIKPIKVIQKVGKTTANPNPTAIKMELPMNILFVPIL